MSILGMFQKKYADKPKTEELTRQDIDLEEYEVADFVPLKLPMTSELIRRQREHEIRKKYCKPSVKTEVLL